MNSQEEKNQENSESKTDNENKPVEKDLSQYEIPENCESENIKIVKKGNENSQLNISYNFLFKVSLIGDSGTGKTSILTRFIDNVFKEDTATTIGVDFKIVSFDLGENTFAKMQIWDTCGSERFRSLTASFLKTCSAFILVFDLTRVNTLNNIDNWIKTINENTKPKFLILIGNKRDLIEDRKVSKEDILKYCEKNNINYIEISAKDNDNVEKIFKEVAYQLYAEIKAKKLGEEKGALKEFEIGGYKNIKIANGKKENEKENKKAKFCCG